MAPAGLAVVAAPAPARRRRARAASPRAAAANRGCSKPAATVAMDPIDSMAAPETRPATGQTGSATVAGCQSGCQRLARPAMELAVEPVVELELAAA